MGLGVARGQESRDRTENALGRNWMVVEQRKARGMSCVRELNMSSRWQEE